jgi:magnesium transporter
MSDIIKEKKELRKLLCEKDSKALRRKLSNTDPADVADLLEDLNTEDVEQIFSILDNETASEVIVEMEPRGIDDVLEALSAEKLASMISEMAPDDAVDFYKGLSEEEQAFVWSRLDNEHRRELKELLEYEEDSAGGIMTPELCAVPYNVSIQQAIKAIAAMKFEDPISVVFIVDSRGRPLGYINIGELLAQPKDKQMKDVALKLPVEATLNDDQEDIANKFRKYDLYVMPVVNEEGRLVGRITADDVMDVMHEEANEDFAHISGAPDIEHNEDSPIRIVRLRLPWLMITLVTGLLISCIVQKIIGLKHAGAMAAFVPAILAMGGNTGMQASAVTIRNIALGEIAIGKLLSVLGREILVGLIMGAACAAILSSAVYLLFSYFPATEAMHYSPLRLALIVGCSMCAAMSFAAATGSMLPIILNQLKIDPAVASGPFVTTGNDLSASLIYLFMCYILISV